jgi:hypothetical protein
MTKAAFFKVLLLLIAIKKRIKKQPSNILFGYSSFGELESCVAGLRSLQ